jgi:hypothetical protein
MRRKTGLALSLLLTTLPLTAAADDDGPPLSVYGFARLDFIVDDSRMSDAQTPFFVEPEADDPDNAEMSLHPRLSRIGLTVDEYELADDLEAEGRLEVDFQNGGTDSSAIMRLRHAYATLNLDDKVEILAGQTWDLASPLFPAANNDSMMWNAGNTGDRRPQFRVTAMPGDKIRMGVSVATTGAVDAQDLDGDGRLDGTESGVPMFQGLIEYRMRLSGPNPFRIGFWGHTAQEELADGTELTSRGVGAHVFLPLVGPVAVLGEIYRGRNLSDIRGGIGQGINPARMIEIDSTGGWIEMAIVPNNRHMLAVGNTADNPDSEDLEAGDRDLNTTTYAVYRYRPHESVQLGLEYIRWNTEYKLAPDAAANRFNVHMTTYF